MIDSIIALIGRNVLGKNLLSLVAAINSKLVGNRTQILILLELILYTLKTFGGLPPEIIPQVDALSAALLGALPITLAEKISRGESLASKILP